MAGIPFQRGCFSPGTRVERVPTLCIRNKHAFKQQNKKSGRIMLLENITRPYVVPFIFPTGICNQFKIKLASSMPRRSSVSPEIPCHAQEKPRLLDCVPVVKRATREDEVNSILEQ